MESDIALSPALCIIKRRRVYDKDNSVVIQEYVCISNEFSCDRCSDLSISYMSLINRNNIHLFIHYAKAATCSLLITHNN